MADMIRISASYLFNIMLKDTDGEEVFLLTKGERRDQYQPIGGAYKYYPEARPFLESLGAQFEESSRGVKSDDDLRLSIPKENVYDFEQWYRSGVGREVNCTRELYEELVSFMSDDDQKEFESFDGFLLKAGEFEEFVENGVNTIKPMDIIGIVPSEIQTQLIFALIHKYPERFLLATRKEIEEGKVVGEKSKIVKNIGDHTKKIFETDIPENSEKQFGESE